MADSTGSAGDRASGDDPDPDGTAPREPLLAPATKSSLLWGLVGGLAFLVLAQGYELLGNLGVGFGAKVAVALVVAVGAAVATHLTRGRLPTENESH
ncbi:hypothetical protein C475_04346 [Halosimplex carlsbadense 2-9-1]|uniref:DUF7981 domain-containing protein n=1 Tax=Halosimplex carlsbadense 2-9-1 TaxID=797114 RepID=M0D2B2_9EURY|nr:hypothetical protein [Halosimplex carlsbadense]ELZ28837.1 hypothetical protein C475_04346 [Halosimplex carlsbadense 2-9-1]